MGFEEGATGVVENMVFSYDARLQEIESAFDTTRRIISDFHKSFSEIKQERDRINSDLKEALARNGSLRKRDFDTMIVGFLSVQEGEEREIGNLVDGYFCEQGKTAGDLREGLKKFRECLVSGESVRVREYRAMISRIIAAQEERRNEVTARLKKFQQKQQEIAKRLKSLSAKGRELRITDLKLMLEEYNPRHTSGAARREARKTEVHRMLDGFKNSRWEEEEARRARSAAASSCEGVIDTTINSVTKDDRRG
ncbi:MAG: hypothetical protein WCP22_04575 [Chlamydiota bacterium]